MIMQCPDIVKLSLNYLQIHLYRSVKVMADSLECLTDKTRLLLKKETIARNLLSKKTEQN